MATQKDKVRFNNIINNISRSCIGMSFADMWEAFDSCTFDREKIWDFRLDRTLDALPDVPLDEESFNTLYNFHDKRNGKQIFKEICDIGPEKIFMPAAAFVNFAFYWTDEFNLIDFISIVRGNSNFVPESDFALWDKTPRHDEEMEFASTSIWFGDKRVEFLMHENLIHNYFVMKLPNGEFVGRYYDCRLHALKFADEVQ